jgi:hypothetical protein
VRHPLQVVKPPAVGAVERPNRAVGCHARGVAGLINVAWSGDAGPGVASVGACRCVGAGATVRARARARRRTGARAAARRRASARGAGPASGRRRARGSSVGSGVLRGVAAARRAREGCTRQGKDCRPLDARAHRSRFSAWMSSWSRLKASPSQLLVHTPHGRVRLSPVAGARVVDRPARHVRRRPTLAHGCGFGHRTGVRSSARSAAARDVAQRAPLPPPPGGSGPGATRLRLRKRARGMRESN